MDLFIDCTCVHEWLSDTFTERPEYTPSSSQIPIRRRLSTVEKLVSEYDSSVDIKLVISNQNGADKLTRVPRRWLDAGRKETELVQLFSAVAVSKCGSNNIKLVRC